MKINTTRYLITSAIIAIAFYQPSAFAAAKVEKTEFYADQFDPYEFPRSLAKLKQRQMQRTSGRVEAQPQSVLPAKVESENIPTMKTIDDGRNNSFSRPAKIQQQQFQPLNQNQMVENIPPQPSEIYSTPSLQERRPVNPYIKNSVNNMQARYQQPMMMQQTTPTGQYQATPYTSYNQQFANPNPNLQVNDAGMRNKPLYTGEDMPGIDVNKLGVKITPKVGTQGLGLEIGTALSDYIAIRAGGNYATYSDEETVDDVTYDYDANVLNGNALIDLHPFKNGFRITGGAYFNPDKVEFSATPSQSVTVGDTIYSPAQIGTIAGEVETSDVSPYAGLGYSAAFTESGDWFIDADAGVKFNNVRTRSSSTGTLANDPALQADLRQEEREIQDQFEILEYYPVINFGVGYKF